MADAADDSRALVPADPDASTVAAPQTRTRRQKWEVEYARYFGTLRQDSSASPPPGSATSPGAPTATRAHGSPPPPPPRSAPDDASSYEEQASDHMMEALTVSYHEEPEHMIEAPTMSYHEEPDLPVLQPLSASHTNNSYSGFPPSFSQMLANCSTKDEQDTEESYPVGATNHAPQEVYAPDNSHDVAVATEEMIADKGMDAVAGIDTSILTGDIVTRIKTMSDDSFKDMLFKLEKVIDELGGDMSL
ncbi:unnamed protein product [Urochloa decumbens]|uniref:Uncharacterized protein n=1 Tax=Urochloa decumbens TaxID=240449 RepID=A0ABC9CX73_9POAL